MNFFIFLIFIVIYCKKIDDFDDENEEFVADDADFQDAYEFSTLQSLATLNHSIEPFLISLAINPDNSQLFITWSSISSLPNPIVLFGQLSNLKDASTISATDQSYSLHNNQYQSQFIYKAIVNNFEPGKKYFYKVGSEKQFSKIFQIIPKPKLNETVTKLKSNIFPKKSSLIF